MKKAERNRIQRLLMQSLLHHDIMLPSDYLFILLNFGQIEDNFKTRLYFSMKGYDDILLSTIPNLDTLDMWYENNWNEIMKKNNKLGNYYVPVSASREG